MNRRLIASGSDETRGAGVDVLQRRGSPTGVQCGDNGRRCGADAGHEQHDERAEHSQHASGIRQLGCPRGQGEGEPDDAEVSSTIAIALNAMPTIIAARCSVIATTWVAASSDIVGRTRLATITTIGAASNAAAPANVLREHGDLPFVEFGCQEVSEGDSGGCPMPPRWAVPIGGSPARGQAGQLGQVGGPCTDATVGASRREELLDAPGHAHAEDAHRVRAGIGEGVRGAPGYPRRKTRPRAGAAPRRSARSSVPATTYMHSSTRSWVCSGGPEAHGARVSSTTVMAPPVSAAPALMVARCRDGCVPARRRARKGSAILLHRASLELDSLE